MRFSGTGSRNSETLSNQRLQPCPVSDRKAQHWGLAGYGSKCSLIPVTATLEGVQYEAEKQPYFPYKID